MKMLGSMVPRLEPLSLHYMLSSNPSKRVISSVWKKNENSSSANMIVGKMGITKPKNRYKHGDSLDSERVVMECGLSKSGFEIVDTIESL
jgi:hypothetical protein